MELAGDHMAQPSTLKQYRVTRAMYHCTVHTKQHNTRTIATHDLLWHWSSLVRRIREQMKWYLDNAVCMPCVEYGNMSTLSNKLNRDMHMTNLADMCMF